MNKRLIAVLAAVAAMAMGMAMGVTGCGAKDDSDNSGGNTNIPPNDVSNMPPSEVTNTPPPEVTNTPPVEATVDGTWQISGMGSISYSDTSYMMLEQIGSQVRGIVGANGEGITGNIAGDTITLTFRTAIAAASGYDNTTFSMSGTLNQARTHMAGKFSYDQPAVFEGGMASAGANINWSADKE